MLSFQAFWLRAGSANCPEALYRDVQGVNADVEPHQWIEEATATVAGDNADVGARAVLCYQYWAHSVGRLIAKADDLYALDWSKAFLVEVCEAIVDYPESENDDRIKREILRRAKKIAAHIVISENF